MVDGRIEFANTGSSIFLGAGTGGNDDKSVGLNIGIGDSVLSKSSNPFHNIGIGYKSLHGDSVGMKKRWPLPPACGDSL